MNTAEDLVVVHKPKQVIQGLILLIISSLLAWFWFFYCLTSINIGGFLDTVVIVILLNVVIEILLLLQLNDGRNWARVISLIIQILTIYNVFFSSTQPGAMPGLKYLLLILSLAAAIIAFILLFHKDSSKWYKYMKEQRKALKLADNG